MPSHPRPRQAPDPNDPADDPDDDATAAPEEDRPPTSPDHPDPDALWLRVGDAGGERADPPEADHPPAVSVADVESALDGLGVEVDALGAEGGGEGEERDLQRVVDHYERLIAERERALRDDRSEDAPDDPRRGRGPLAAVRSGLRAIVERLRR